MSEIPQPQPKQPSAIRNQFIAAGIIVVLALLGLVALSLIQNRAEPSVANQIARTRTARQSVAAPQVYHGQVMDGSGRNDIVSDEFRLPAGCSKPILYFDGRAIDRDVDVAFVNFRFYDEEITDYAVDSSGPHDLVPTGEGSDRLRIEAGHTYYIEISAFNANWSYHVDCD